MTFDFTTSTRETLEQIVRDPRFKPLTRVAVLPLPTVGLLGAVILAFATTAYLWLNGLLPTWFVVAINGVLIYAIFTPLHAATHRPASSHPRINDLIGTIALIGFIPGVTTRIYRYLHLEHHRYAGDRRRDPDEIFVSARWPWAAWVIATPDITWTIWYIRAWRTRPVSERIEFSIGITLYVLWHTAFLTSAYAVEFLILWLIPQRIGMSLVVHFFARIQHPEGVEWETAPFQTTVHVPTNPVARRLMLGQAEHHIHHLMPSVPFFRYHQAFELSERLLANVGIPTRGFFTGATAIEIGEIEEPRQSAVVASTQALVDGVNALTITTQDGAPPLAAFTPGAHVDVFLPTGIVRQYSLVHPDDGTGTYRIVVKHEAKGRGGSRAMHELKAGDAIEVGVPRNSFPLRAVAKTVVLMAGGIGITPLWCMAHDLDARGVAFTLTACVRTRADFAFRDELTHKRFADRVRIAPDNEGPGTEAVVADAVPAWTSDQQLYVCGPSGFVELVMATAKAHGWPDTAICNETFVAPIIGGATNRAFDVTLARSGQTLKVGADEYLIDVLHRNGIAVPCSCTQGICGSCVTRVVEGEVDHRDAFLTDEDRSSNRRMTVCVSRASGDSITLDL